MRIRKVYLAALGVSLFLVSMDVTAFAKTKWPGSQAGLKPGESSSPMKAVLPDDLTIEAPGDGVSDSEAAYSGIWTGWMCRNRIGSTKLAVEKIHGDAHIVYAFASALTREPFARKLKAKFKDGELVVKFRNEITVTYGMRPDGHLNVKWQNPRTNARCYGILSRE